MDNEPTKVPLPSSITSSAPPILLDTLFLIFLRLIYFLLSRRFLLSTINPTLRDLSKPETLLPPIVSLQAENERPRSSNRSQGFLPLSDLEFDEIDTEEDGILSRTTPNSSYPPTPSKPNISLPNSSHSNRDPFTRRNTDDPFLHLSGSSLLPATPENGIGGIELQTLGQKLKDVGTGVGKKVQVLQLNHARRDVGSKGIKKATRGLSRLSR